MIKSKFSFLGLCLLWLLSLGGLLILYMTLGAVVHFLGFDLIKTSLTDAEFIIVLVFYIPLTVIAFTQVKVQSDIIYIDILNNTIFFKNYFFRHKRIYSISEFEGYIDTLIKSPNGNFRVLYLVKNRKLAHKLSRRFYSNLEEIEDGLSNLRYLGFHKFSLAWSLRIFFTKKM